MVNALDVPVLTFDYSGHDRESFWLDPATLKTNIDDTIAVTNHVMSQFGYARNVFAPKSAGINPALAAMDDRTNAVIAGLAIPDFLLTISEPYLAAHPYKRLGLQAMFATVGVCHWKPSSNYTTVPSIKITRDFYESTKVHTVDRILKENTTRVPVHLVGNDGDRFCEPRYTGKASGHIAPPRLHRYLHHPCGRAKSTSLRKIRWRRSPTRWRLTSDKQNPCISGPFSL